MLNLVLSIFLSVLLLINFRIFPRYRVNTTQAIGLNYLVCFAVGLLFIPTGQQFELNFGENWTWYCLALGVGFIVTFLLSGMSTQRAGITATSLANNLSLVIPVLASLTLYNTRSKEFDAINYLGMALALIAVGMATYSKPDTGRPTHKINSSVWLPVAVFLLYGITNAAINYINIEFIPEPEKVIPVTLVMVFGALVSGVVLVLYRLLRHKERIASRNLLAAVTLGVPNFLSFYFLIKTLSAFGNSGAFVYPVYNMGVIFVSSVAGIFFFGESLSKINKIGLDLSFAAILLLSYQELFFT